MKKDLLRQHIEKFISNSHQDPDKFVHDVRERTGLISYYRHHSRDRIMEMIPQDIYEYLSQLWAMQIWGNKHYVVDKIIEDNGLEPFRRSLGELVWCEDPIASRWDAFRKGVKGMGPAMISEVLCKSHPDAFMLWNRRAYVGLNYLQVEGLPRYDYQLTGRVYTQLCDVCKMISAELKTAGLEDSNLLAVDYFIWEQLQVEDNLSRIHVKKPDKAKEEDEEAITESSFIHNDVRDKLRDIGQWLGFEARIEQRVSEGSKVDAIWEAAIGNMGRVIYVFEVQTKGS